jgi:hypothetical protein
MPDEAIPQNLIPGLGQSQRDRLPVELGRHFVDVDERDGAALLAQATALAKLLRFYATDPATPSGDWSPFFPPPDPAAPLLDRGDGSVSPHLGLFAAFVQLYGYPQRAINTVTGRHLDFQFRRVLRFVPKPARPDHALLLVELKPGTGPAAITRADEFSAGKDSSGVEVVYAPVRDVVANQGQVASLRAFHRDGPHLYFAPVANSSDGLGGALDSAQPKWPPFGTAALPPAPVGFAVASPVLRMSEGVRTVEVDLELIAFDPTHLPGAGLSTAFRAYLTGPTGWFSPAGVVANFSPARLILSVTLDASFPAVIDYDPKVHTQPFGARAPVLQFLLDPTGPLSYGDLESLTLGKAQVRVTADGLTSLDLENDLGTLNPKKPFLPFGPQPVVGSRFLIGCDEAHSKRLLELSLTLIWQGAPANLYANYNKYSNQARLKSGVLADLVYQDRSRQPRTTTVTLMNSGANTETTLSPDAPAPSRIQWADYRPYALLVSDTQVGRVIGTQYLLRLPIFDRADVPPPEPQGGFITVALRQDLLHADYRRETIQQALNRKPGDSVTVLHEPYTPTVQAVRLSYRAESDEVNLAADSEDAFTNLDLQFFHVDGFGTSREHAYLRNRLPFLADKRVALLPPHPEEGELLIGLSGVGPGDGVSLMVQAAEGSADPDLPPPVVTWSVLADNHWRPFPADEPVLDTTDSFRQSGIVALALPSPTTTRNTVLPTGLVWLRASIATGSAAACELVDVEDNGVEVRFTDRGNDPARLVAATPAGSITKLRVPRAEVKGVTQPYAGFGGSPMEGDGALTTRAAERVRHRDRCITPWDSERILLEAFPAVHAVKCIPHASDASWLAPGNVLIVVVPDLRNKNAVDPLRPRVDAGTLDQLAAYVQDRCGMQVKVKVKNPRYQRVRLDFKVRFTAGSPFTFYRGRLNDALVAFLTPWAGGGDDPPIAFGGQVARSVVLNFVERLPYVDFVTDFKLLSLDSATPGRDVALAAAETPDAILVSDASHAIGEVVDS